MRLMQKTIHQEFYFYLSKFSNESVKELFPKTTVKQYTLDIIYVINGFVKTPHNENYGCIFFKSYNKPFQHYLYFLQTIMKIHFNSYSQFSNLTIDYAIDENKTVNLDS